MAFEQRGDKFYAYRKRRTPDGVVSDYLGTGYGAQSYFLGRKTVRLYEKWYNEDLESLEEATEAADDALDLVCDTNRDATRLLLAGLGFYQHKGQWRRRRGVSTWHDSDVPFPQLDRDTPRVSFPPGSSTFYESPSSSTHPNDHSTTNQTETDMGQPANPLAPRPPANRDEQGETDEEKPLVKAPDINDPAPPPDEESEGPVNYTDLPLGNSSFQEATEALLDENTLELLKLNVKRMRQYIKAMKSRPPNQEAADTIREFLCARPALWSQIGLLPWLAARELAKTLAPDHEEDHLLILTQLDRFRVDLGLLESPPHEQLLIDQVALAMLSYQVTAYLHSMFAYGPGRKPKYGEYWAERLATTERRLDYAVTQLARVRKLTRSTKKVQKDLAAYLEGIAPPRTKPAGDGEPRHQWWWGPERPEMDPERRPHRPNAGFRPPPPTVEEQMDALLEKYPDYIFDDEPVFEDEPSEGPGHDDLDDGPDTYVFPPAVQKRLEALLETYPQVHLHLVNEESDEEAPDDGSAAHDELSETANQDAPSTAANS